MVNNRLKFASSQSHYQMLVDSQENTNYTYWSSKCEGELFFLYLSVGIKIKISFIKENPCIKILVSVIFLDLGDGWAPAVLNSEEEWHFIRGGRAGKDHLHSYWIGGSSDADTAAGETIRYYQYINTGSGNHIIVCPMA